MHLKHCTSNLVYFLFQISSFKDISKDWWMNTHKLRAHWRIWSEAAKAFASRAFLLVPLLLLILLLERKNVLIENPDCVGVSLPTHSLRIQPGLTFSKSWIWAESSKAIRPRAGRPLSFSSSVGVRRESKVYLYSSTAFLNTLQILHVRSTVTRMI